MDPIIPAESQVSDSTQSETSEAPVSDSNPAEVAEEVEEEAPAPKRPSERTVPVSALIQERRRNQERLASLQHKIADLEAKYGREEEEDDEQLPDEQEKHRRTWTKHLGVDKLSKQVKAINDAIQDITQRMQGVDALQQGSQLAVRQYVKGVEQYAESQYDDTLPITRAQFNKLVAAEITPDYGDRLYEGDMTAIDEIVKIVKSEFRKPNANATRKANEVKKVTNLPKIPGKGGNLPQAREDEKPFTSLRDLHKDAWDTFKSAQERRQE